MHGCRCKGHMRPPPSQRAALVEQGSALMVSCLSLEHMHCWVGREHLYQYHLLQAVNDCSWLSWTITLGASTTEGVLVF